MNIKKLLLLFMLLLSFVSCSVVDVRTDYDPKINLVAFKKYTIINYEDGDSLINNRVTNAIKNEMDNKHYEHVDIEDAEFYIFYRYTAVNKSRETKEYVKTGFGRYGMYSGYYATSTYHYQEGNFEIRMANPKTKETFWRVDGKNALKDLKTPAERVKYTNEIIDKMLEAYPKFED